MAIGNADTYCDEFTRLKNPESVNLHKIHYANVCTNIRLIAYAKQFVFISTFFPSCLFMPFLLLLSLPVHNKWKHQMLNAHPLCEHKRYAPLMPTQQNMIFTVEGIHVNSDHVCNDNFCTIHLDNLNNDSSGAYRCEVSGEAPEFKLSHETSNMTVAGKQITLKV